MLVIGVVYALLLMCSGHGAFVKFFVCVLDGLRGGHLDDEAKFSATHIKVLARRGKSRTQLLKSRKNYF